MYKLVRKHPLPAAVALSLAAGSFSAAAAPAYQLPSTDLKNAMSQTLTSAASNSLSQTGDTMRYQLDNFKADVTCFNGWLDISDQYSSHNAYYQCEGSVQFSPVAGDLEGIIGFTVNSYQVIISDNGEFFGELREIPNLGFDGANLLTDNMSGSRFAFAVAKGAILNDYAKVKVGLPDNRIMAFFDLSYTDGGKMALTDSIEASVGSNSASFKFVLDWKDPLYYFETNLFTKGALSSSPVQLTSQGLSYHGRLGFDADYPLWDGNSWQGASFNGQHWEVSDNFDSQKFNQDGHLVLGGKVKFTPYPISVDGLFNVDFDQNDDGLGGGQGFNDKVSKKLTELASDTQVAGNGTLEVDLGDVSGIGFSMNLGKGSVNFNSAQKSFSFWANSVDPLEGGIAGNWIKKLLKGLQTPDVQIYGHMDIDDNGLSSYDSFFKADLSHHGFLLKGSQSMNYKTPGVKDGFTMDGHFGYKGSDIGFTLEASEHSCNATIDTGINVNIAGHNLGSASFDLCQAVDNSLIPVSGIVNVAGNAIDVIGNTSATAVDTLSSEAHQTIHLVDGRVEEATVELKEAGLTVNNAAMKYGNKAHRFVMGDLNYASGTHFAQKFSNYIAKNGLSTGNLSLGGGGLIKWKTFKIYGDGKYRGEVNGSNAAAKHETQLKVEFCAKVKVAGKGRKTCKTDHLDTITGNLDANGCFSTPGLNKSFSLLGVKVKFPIPSKKFCMF
ncbi:hypothetical protein [Thalassomonas actiniarum]|uniref:Uncharacterized protein n=1 Tax=Thalassomonas actiniarum TaxID=485447 RepID=A0AAF0C794_9GAMM|nr:hypothetical protein [Thalassomonas actiniarum]WDE02624.1 hypothetical protein SG35_029920 [Thalassomonas actiniarum]